MQAIQRVQINNLHLSPPCTDEQRREQRLAGSGRIVELNKKEFEKFVASCEPGKLLPLG